MTNTDSNASARSSERRLHTRQRVLFSCVQLADSNGGIVLNVCERGLALRAARILRDDQFRQVRFQLSHSDAWVETRGRIRWISDSKTMAGMEFADLSTEARILLAQWISSIADDSATAGRERPPAKIAVEPPSAPSAEVTDRVSITKPEEPEDFVGQPSQDSTILKPSFARRPSDPGIDLRPQPCKEGELQAQLPKLPGFRQEKITPTAVTYRRKRFRLLIVLFVTLALPVAGFFGLVRYRRNEPVRVKKTENRTIAVGLAWPSGGSPSRSNPSQKLSSVSTASESVPGFVLQAGAMRHAENADTLRRSLEQKRFPSFIFKGETDHLYVVFVGPYPDPKMAAKTRKELQDQGFTTIVRHWPLQ